MPDGIRYLKKYRRSHRHRDTAALHSGCVCKRCAPGKGTEGLPQGNTCAGEEQEVSFEIREEMLRFLRADGTVGSEPGKFRVWIAKDCTQGDAAEFWYE